MSSETIEQAPLREYISLVRRRKLVIASMMVICGLAGLLISLGSDPAYQAESSIRVDDRSTSVGLVGLLPTQGDDPAQTAAQAAEVVTRTRVLEQVRRSLELDVSVGALRKQVRAAADARSNLVNIIATAPTAEESARLANALALEGSKSSNRVSRDGYRRLATRLRRQVDSVPDESPNTQRRRSVINDQVARLQALATVAELAQVASEASVPNSPSSPKTARNTAVASLAGLLLGLIAASVIESLDRRLRHPEDAQEVFGSRVLGVLPDHAVGGVPISGLPGEEHVAAMDVFRMLRTNIGFLNVDAPPRVVLITSSLPEEGKTTVAVGVALAAAAAGRRTLLVEADLHRPVLSDRLGIVDTPGLTDYLAADAVPQEVLQTVTFADPAVRESMNGSHARAQLTCISAGKPGAWSTEFLSSSRFAHFLDEVRAVYDLVVIDSAPILATAETLEIVPRVDAVIFCARAGKTTVEQLRAGRETLNRLPPKPTGLVVTGVAEPDAEGYSYYSYAYNYRFQAPEGRRLFKRKTATKV